ncbi:phosphate ABC transporter permease PstA [Salinarimonas rosea]|uniref:phosphate ABC transporter permease PstA n=1 Tax=Salinarimonas rosea TaxID=552063 RepID=UPI00040AA128|nr:phosphate ABC transporter permease PstA [Salinarimonas rosea]
MATGTADTTTGAARAASPTTRRVQASLARRRAAETRFRLLGLAAVIVGLGLVALLFATILTRGLPAFWQATLTLEVFVDPEIVDVPPAPERSAFANQAEYEEAFLGWQTALARTNWGRVLRNALLAYLPPEAADSGRAVEGLIASNERFELRALVQEDPGLIGETIVFQGLADANVDVWVKGNIDRSLPDDRLPLTSDQRAWIELLLEQGVLTQEFASALLFNVDSRSSPASAGLAGAFVGSLFMMLIVIVLSVPIGVAAAIYLEEFAPRNRFTDFIEVNINNLAAVPSIVFGLLGAAVFINWFRLPLSAPLVGGLVLTLMTLPTIIIATRSTLRAIPPSIRQAAIGLGASKVQTVAHHVLPLAIPGILTGAIIGVAQALGETAPLLLIGMSAFVAQIPTSPMDSSTALPVQIYLWQGNELRNFFEARTSAAIIVLLALLLSLNTLAIILRKRFEKRW